MTDQSSPGIFAWTDGSPFSYTNWAPGQPDSGGAGNACAALDPNAGNWEDHQCDSGSAGWTSLVCGVR